VNLSTGPSCPRLAPPQGERAAGPHLSLEGFPPAVTIYDSVLEEISPEPNSNFIGAFPIRHGIAQIDGSNAHAEAKIIRPFSILMTTFHWGRTLLLKI
jgi:hypothetical protein